MSILSLRRKKKQQTGAIHLLGPGGKSDRSIPIEVKPNLLVQNLIDLAAEKAQIKPTAVPFFGLYDPERRCWLYPFRCLEKTEASIHWYFRVQFKVANSVELRRLDSVAFEYYIMQCRSDFVADLYSNVSLEDALRLACLDILLATLRLKISFQEALKQFGIQHFLPKSARDKLKTREALIDVITKSFKNFEHMSDEAASIRYVEIVEHLPGFDVHRFKMCLDRLLSDKVVSEDITLTLSHHTGIVQVRQESFMDLVCSLNDISSIHTSLSSGSSKLLVHLNRLSGATRVFSCGRMETLETFCSMVDGYCRLLIDHTRTVVEGIIHPDCNIPRTELGQRCPVVRRRSPKMTRDCQLQINGASIIEPNSHQQQQQQQPNPNQLSNESPFVEKMTQIHGPINRDEAKQLLQAASPVDGLYLVRENAKVKGSYGLSVWIRNEVKHYLVQKHPEGYGIQDGLRFQTISALLQHYHDERDGLCTKLTKLCLPVATQESPFVKRKKDVENRPPPVPLSPRPSQCLLSSNNVTLMKKVREGLFGSVSIGELSLKDSTLSAAEKVHVLLSCLDEASFIVGQQLTQLCSTLHQLEHKRLVKYYGVFNADKSTYLVHECAELGPLDDYLASKTQSELPEKLLLAIAAQVADGLLYLQSKSCVHGGVTAHTVLVSSPCTVKLSDVGMVAQAAVVDRNYFHQDHGVGRHLLPWLAVECINGCEMSHASDVWAAGVLLWEIFNYGTQKPFEGSLPSQVRNLIQQGGRLGPIKDCPDAVYDVMKSCWSSDVTARLSNRDLCESLLNLAKKAATPSATSDSKDTQNGRINGIPPVSQHSSTRQSGETGRRVLHRFPSVGSRSAHSARIGPPVHQRSSSDSGQSGQDSSTIHLSIKSLNSLASDKSPPKTAPQPKPRASNSKAPSRMDLALEELAKTNIIDVSDLSMGKELGLGQFGLVKQAVWTKSDGTTQETAVKALIADADVEQQRDFFREAKAMIELDNPYIVRLLGICFQPSLLLVTELVRLGAVNAYLRDRRHDPPAPRILMSYGVQIATGMTYLESHRLVHRDLAARNILVSTPSTIKITDFGLSRVFGGDKEYYVAANLGKWPIKWYAPESINFRKFSHKSDVWSYGITLWEIFMLGRKPYGKMAPQEVLGFIESGKRLKKPALCPQDVYEMMENCWRQEPDERPSFIELRQKMETLQQRA